MATLIYTNILRVTSLLLIVKGIRITEGSPVSLEVSIPYCHYKSNGSCIMEVTLFFPSTETEKVSFSIDYQLSNTGNERRVADCGWTLEKFTCLRERGYSYTTHANSTFQLSIDLNIYCVNGVTFSITLNQKGKLLCNLQQDLNRTSDDGKYNQTAHSSERSLIEAPIVIVLTTVAGFVAVVTWCCREKLKKYCCRCNEDGTLKVQAEDIQDPSLAPLNESPNQQNFQEPHDAR